MLDKWFLHHTLKFEIIQPDCCAAVVVLRSKVLFGVENAFNDIGGVDQCVTIRNSRLENASITKKVATVIEICVCSTCLRNHMSQ